MKIPDNKISESLVQGIIDSEKKASTYEGPDRIEHFKKYLELKNDKSFTVFGTGIETLDEFTENMETGELIVISGETGQGKTLFAETVGNNLMKAGQPILWLSYEVSVHKFLQKYSDDEKRPLFVPMELKNMDTEWLKFKALEAKVKYGVRVIFIDHLHYLVDMATRQNMSLNIGATMRFLKQDIAIGLNMLVFIIAHTQQPRTQEDPTIGSIRDCLPEGQLVNSRGKRIPVESLKPGDMVYSRKSIKKLQEDVVTAVWPSGIKKILRIKTKLGRQIDCSDGHKLFALTHKSTNIFGPHQGAGVQGWTEAKNLKVGQKIAVVRRYPDINFDRIVSIEDIGIKPTYDVSVRGHHKSIKNNSFCVNDILTHNSSFVGQESDLVLMVMRKPDSGWKKGKEKTFDENKTKVIVEKARRSGALRKKVILVKNGNWLEETSQVEEEPVEKEIKLNVDSNPAKNRRERFLLE